ncbi:MAG: hypothetical protein ABI977_32530 [Acidobacteriota bacterium]
MVRSYLLCAVVLFALAEPACDTSPSDAKNESHKVQPGQNPDPDNAHREQWNRHNGFAPAPTPAYEAHPTFEPQPEGRER